MNVWRPSLIEVAALSALVMIVLIGPTRTPRALVRPSITAIVATSVAGGVLTLLVAPAHAVLIAIALLTLAAIAWLLARSRARARARATSAAVRVVCGELADDLRIGRTPADAITAAAERWPPLRPALAAARLQHDVVPALHEIARLPGAEGLRDVAVAWQVSAHAGSGLMEALERVSRLLAARERRVRLVDSELAAARATAAVVCGLPFLVLLMGSGLGTNPWAFFLGGVGSGVLLLATILIFAGWAWLDRLMSRGAST